MKNVMKGLFSVVLLLSITSAVAADSVGAHSYFLSGAGDVTRLPMNGTHRDSDKMYGCLNVQVEYNQNTKRADLGKYFFFGTDNTMRVDNRRTAATTKATTQFYNLNLLLPTDYNATVTILPKIQTVTTNIAGFVGLDEFMEGLHLTVDLPLVYTKTDMALSQSTSVGTATVIVDGIIAVGGDTTTTNTQAGGFIQAIKGASVDGDVATAMLYGKIDGAQPGKFKLGNATIALGYDFMNKENMHLGVAVVGLVNGASGSTAEFWGEHAIGTAGRHAVGGRVNGHVRLYENDDAEINAHLNANVFGTFASTVRRSYDWNGHGNGSRYILIKEFTTAPVYNRILHYGTNISSLKAKVNAGLLYDVSAGLCYTNGNLRLDAGYQLNGHGAEKHKGWVDTVTASKYGHFATTVTTGTIGASGAAATANVANGDDVNSDTSLTVNVSGDTSSGVVSVAATTANLLTTANLNIDSGLAPSAMAHRIHGGASYNWADNEWEPALGVYGGGQIAGNNNALSGWFVGFNGSVCF